MVGLDVTEQCRLTDDEATELVSGDDPRKVFLQEELRRFREQFSFTPVLHDPLTLLSMLENDICEYQQMDIQVETRGTMTRGVTVNCRFSENKRIRVAVRVNAKAAVHSICRMVQGKLPA